MMRLAREWRRFHALDVLDARCDIFGGLSIVDLLQQAQILMAANLSERHYVHLPRKSRKSLGA